MTMRTISNSALGKELLDLINEVDPAHEDIGIVDENGKLQAVILTPDAYAFFLRKIEEEENRIDNETVDAFHRSREGNE
jgi:PHD/YefM family antitoxin component YafN of YafNO toxin-antitoxin module